jgi:purine-cytosine permease-like protein
MMSLGVAYTLAFVSTSTDANALLLALSGVALGIPLLLILVDEHENAFADIHSAAVSAGTSLPLSIGKLTLGIGLLCTLIAWRVPLTQYENFLLLIGSVFAPLFGVVLTHHFVLRQQTTRDLNWRSLAAWAIGIVVYQLMANFLPDIGATLPSLFVAGWVCWGLGRKVNS